MTDKEIIERWLKRQEKTDAIEALAVALERLRLILYIPKHEQTEFLDNSYRMIRECIEPSEE